MGRLTRTRLADLAVLAALVAGAHKLYRASPGAAQMCDSCYSLAVAERLWAAGTLRVDGLVPNDPAARANLPGYQPPTDLPYHLWRLPAGVFYVYPLGSSVLSAPLVGYHRWAKGLSAAGPDGTYDLAGETKLQLRAAAAVTAAAVGVFFVTARAVLPAAPAALVAAWFAAGSMAWSTLSRSLWSHTWAALLLALAVLAAVRLAARRPGPAAQLLYGAVVGGLTFWAWFVRPQTAISGAALFAFLAGWRWRAATTAALAAAGCLAAYVGWSYLAFGTPAPPTAYAGEKFDAADVGFRAYGLLASPSRGLLVFCPYLAVVAYLLVTYRRHLPAAAVLAPAGLAVGGTLGVLAFYPGWHGAYAYGPRYLSDVLPWFVAASAIAVRGLIDAPTPRRRKAAELAVLAACVGWAVWVHGRGACCEDTWEWNYTAVTRDEHARLAADWRHPQFLAGLTFAVNPDGTFVGR